MKKILIVLLLMPICNALGQNQPVAPVKIVTDEYFGQKIEDPYQYMENMKDPDVINWFKGQGDYARSVLDRINGREELIAKFKELDKRRSSRVTNLRITENDIYFYLKTTPEDETGKLYTRQGFEGEEELLFDPSSYSEDESVQYVIENISPNRDGSKVALHIAANGSETATILILNMADRKFYDEKIGMCWSFGLSWLKDSNSFIYGKLNSDDVTDESRQLNTKAYYHKTGTDPNNDPVIFSGEMNPELDFKPEEIPYLIYDKDSDNLFCIASTVDRNLKVYLADGTDPSVKDLSWKNLIKREDKIEDFFTDHDNFYFKTSMGAPNYKILATPLENMDFQNSQVIVEESPDEVLRDFVITSDALYFTRVKNGIEAKVYRMTKEAKSFEELELPFTAGRAGISSKSVDHDDVWVNISGWTKDSRRFKYTADSGEFKLETLSSLAEFPEFDNIVAQEVMAVSHDGVKVPLSLVYDKSMKKDGETPVLLYGYGSYGISINPFFSTLFMSWISEGGMIAVAHVRGGGELGDKWHKAGFKETKPNTWKDLIACSEYLHREQFSSPEKTVIFGGSAGGILIGRAMTERPDLFAVAVPAVGVMNALRTELEPNGPVNVPEFGTFKIESEFKALVEMDAYLHLEEGVKYPATLITAGINDPRVVAWQPGKFAARLEAVNGSDNPVLFRVDYESGHGSDAKTKSFEEFGDIFSFAFWQTGHPSYQSIKTEDVKMAR